MKLVTTIIVETDNVGKAVDSKVSQRWPKNLVNTVVPESTKAFQPNLKNISYSRTTNSGFDGHGFTCKGHRRHFPKNAFLN